MYVRVSLDTCLLVTAGIYKPRAYCNVAAMILVTVTSPYGYRVQYINLIHYNMKAKRISQRAVKNMIDGNTALLPLLHIGNFDTGKRTSLKRAVSECVYTGRLYYNKDLQTEYHINFDDTGKQLQAYECCMQWIEANRHDNTTCFADCKGGTVSIAEVNTGNYVCTENI